MWMNSDDVNKDNNDDDDKDGSTPAKPAASKVLLRVQTTCYPNKVPLSSVCIEMPVILLKIQVN